MTINWEDTDESTVMHMLGYGESIWKFSIFREAVVEYECDIQTLLCLVNGYIMRWGLNSDIEGIREYLNFMLNQEKKKMGLD